MAVTITSIILVFSLLLGGTVHAAQESLPNQYLYEVKILSEELVANLPLSDTQRLHAEINLASRRVDEMASLALAGVNAPDAVLLRLEVHLDRVIGLAAGMDQENMTKALIRVRERLDHKIKALNANPHTEQALVRAREMLQIRLRWAELGLSEPNVFRQQVQIRKRYNQPPDNGDGDGPGTRFHHEQEPGDAGYGPGPYGTGTATPGFGYGPGPGPNPDQDTKPGGYGPGPYISRTPTPGSGDGPGPGPEGDPPGYRPGPHITDPPPPCSDCGPGPIPAPHSNQGPNPESGDSGGDPNPHQHSGEDSGNGKGDKP